MNFYTIKYAIRNILRQKAYSITNLIGLSVSFASVFLILYYIQFESGFDRYFTNSDRIARFTIEYNRDDFTSHFARVRYSGIQYLVDDIPEVKSMARLSPFRTCAVKIGENKFYSKGAFATDSNYFTVFNDTLLLGNPKNILNSGKQAVISESIRKKYFPNQDPIGKKISLEHQQITQFFDYTIVGVMKDAPVQAHFHPEILTSLENQDNYSNWNYTYLLLENPNSLDLINEQLANFKKKHFEAENAKYNTLHLQKLHDIHLHSHKDRELEINGDIKNIKILVVLAILIVLVAFLNFTNLNVVSVEKRSKNILVHHLFGSKLYHISMMALWQNIIIVGFSVLLGLTLAGIVYPYFQQVFSLPEFSISSGIILPLAGIVLLLIICGSLIGTFPVLRHKFYSNTINRNGRRPASHSKKRVSGILLFLQFAIVTGLLVSTFVIQSQVNLIMTKRIGGNDQNILNITNLSHSVIEDYTVFKNKLLQISGIEDVTSAMEEPGGETMDAFYYNLEGITKEKFSKQRLNVLTCDHNFLDFYKIKLIAGNNFDPDPDKKQYILNESAIQHIQQDLPADDFLNRKFEFDFDYKKLLPNGEIVGVCKDIHLTSMNEKEKPMVLLYQNMVNSCISIRFSPEALSRSLPEIQATWNELFPNYDFKYHFIDDLYLHRYKHYINQRNFLLSLAILSILIACIGLVAVSVSMTQARKREISIRKANGAKTLEIVNMLNKDLLWWILSALLIAFPLAWYSMNKWLENFAYKIELSWWIFALAGIVAITIAMITVSWQSWKAAKRNPVESLRYE
ncbi:FtsX-like permease family protein [Marinifilum sp. N1E240]|uniref:ABC transporter permease n=1 Tax=Marinifilum sp. N1E240 TaxID=2608082 RepID=UPI00128E1D2E|nr:FtsX-like permease family protein [Marinifilum sp. N1E240]MPQ45556.1 FtsX-like permease family protein [Marinifilum sp. N1E240]